MLTKNKQKSDSKLLIHQPIKATTDSSLAKYLPPLSRSAKLLQPNMAETILTQFAKVVAAELGSAAVQELKLALGLEDELERIKSNLSSIQAVLRDAEKQQTTSDSVKNWLGKLQDVMYDIDDLLDDITTELNLRHKNKGQWRKQVRKFFSRTNTLVLRWRWAHQIKGLCKKLDQIAFERRNFVLSTESMDSEESNSRRETHSKLNRPEFILGRDDDKEAVINSILNCGDCDGLSVVPVVGFGGIGKTTLAQLIYNDNKIENSFDLKLWVYVSEKFRLKKVMKQVISMATGENILLLTMGKLSLEDLRIKMYDALKDKKYLLVLDDLWNEDSNEWRKLRELLDVGARGSTLVVTTRDSKVASIAQTVEEYRLRELSHETCLDIFKRLAFKDDSDHKIDPTLLSLANEIVEMSRGLPLLVTTLGNLLSGETDEREWNLVIRKLKQGHEDILSILKLSYDQLPSYLKLCFLICSVWGKGAEINPWFHLSPFLMALGFLPHDGQGDQLEYIGSKCINELLSKSLLRKAYYGAHDMFSSISMHDLVFDLAQPILADELAVINYNTKEVPEKVRYLRLEEDGWSYLHQSHKRLLGKAKKTRLFLINTSGLIISNALVENVVKNLKSLRVLHLKFCIFEELPRTIGYMKHLRYLNLVGNAGIKFLPDSICNLCNLQTLLVGGCTNLQKLPTDIGRLENLRCFSVTTQQEFLPEDIGLMSSLRTLVLYEFPRLAFLPENTKALENLDSLWITGCKELDLAEGSWSHRGLNTLRILTIDSLPKFTRLPISEKGVSFASLQTLEIIDCEGLIELTGWIEYLTSLKTLVIKGCSNLVGLPDTFYLLDKLEWLGVYRCPILRKRCAAGTGDDWHLISHIPRIEIDGEQSGRKGR